MTAAAPGRATVLLPDPILKAGALAESVSDAPPSVEVLLPLPSGLTDDDVWPPHAESCPYWWGYVGYAPYRFALSLVYPA